MIEISLFRHSFPFFSAVVVLGLVGVLSVDSLGVSASSANGGGIDGDVGRGIGGDIHGVKNGGLRGHR